MVTRNEDSKDSKLLSCTIKMAKSCTIQSENIYYKSCVVDYLELLARVKEIKETALRYELVLYDFSGNLTVYAYKKSFTDKKQALFKDYKYLDNGYALIHGTFRKNQEGLMFFIKYIRNVQERSIIDDFLSRTLLGYIRNETLKF